MDILYAIFAMVIILGGMWLLMYVWVTIDDFIKQYNKRRKESKDLFTAFKYLHSNGWHIMYDTKSTTMKYPQMFYKKYGNGTICVIQQKESVDLSINYTNSNDKNEKKNIKLDNETMFQMNCIFRLDKNTGA